MPNPISQDEATGTSLQQSDRKFQMSFMEAVLGSDLAYETPEETAAAQKREEKNLFLTAVKQMAVRKI